MKQKTFRKELAALTPEMPESFHLRVEAFLDEKVREEAQTAATPERRTLRTGRRIGTRALVIALIAALLLGTAALAATQWDIFRTLRVILGVQPPTADSVMQSVLHREEVNGVVVTIREAGYDGRTLLLQYSYRVPDMAEPLDDLTPVSQRGVGWWVDAFWINGQAMDMAADSGSDYTAGDVPGEIIRTDYWRLDNLGVTLSGEVEIALPIGEMQPAVYRRAIYDAETDQYTLPDRGVVTFRFDAGDTLSRVVTLHPDVEAVLPDVTARVTEAAFTPLMTYITLELAVNPASLEAYQAEHGMGYYAEDGTLIWAYGGADVFAEWAGSLQLVDGAGQMLFPGYYGINGLGNTWAEFIYPYLDASALPEEMWLAPIRGGEADMTLAVRVK